MLARYTLGISSTLIVRDATACTGTEQQRQTRVSASDAAFAVVALTWWLTWPGQMRGYGAIDAIRSVGGAARARGSCVAASRSVGSACVRGAEARPNLRGEGGAHDHSEVALAVHLIDDGHDESKERAEGQPEDKCARQDQAACHEADQQLADHCEDAHDDEPAKA